MTCFRTNTGKESFAMQSWTRLFKHLWLKIQNVFGWRFKI